MECIIRPTTEAAVKLTAKIVAAALRAKPDMVLGLATGGTMEAVYKELVRLHREEELDFSRCTTFNLDEYVGLPPTDVNSYRYFMNHHLFSHVNVDIRKTHLPDGTAADLEAECARYEEKIVKCGGVDLQLLGIGRTGHIGFNEPLSPLRSRTRATPLAPVTLKQNAIYFGGEDKMPRRAITMGVGTILDSRHALLLATGPSKAEIIAKAVEGPVTSMISASALQFHTHATVIVDDAASVKLQEKEFYNWIFQSEPAWKLFH